MLSSDEKYIKFKLPYEDFESDLLTYLNRKCVVVSSFGKKDATQLYWNGALGLNAFIRPCNSSSEHLNISSQSPCIIEGIFDKSSNVLFLHVDGWHNIDSLLKVFRDIDLAQEGFFASSSNLLRRYAQALLFIFSMSHIVVATHPSPLIDLNVVKLLKLVSLARVKYQHSIGGMILRNTPGVSQSWMHNGRLCTPRLLFLLFSDDWIIDELESREAIVQLQHSVEDQIYNVFRKSKLIKKRSPRTCFSIPLNEEFIYIHVDDDSVDDFHMQTIRHITNELLKEQGDSVKQIEILEKLTIGSSSDGSSVQSSASEESASDTEASTDDCNESDSSDDEVSKSGKHKTFRSFLLSHIESAESETFHDPTGKFSSGDLKFTIPTLKVWFQVANKLLTESLTNDESGLTGLEPVLNAEEHLSFIKCQDAYPAAIGAYSQGLPALYDEATHKSHLQKAIKAFQHSAKGEQCPKFLKMLHEECTLIWKSGRQLCEAISVTGNPCAKAQHAEEDEEHWNGLITMSYCDCGIKQSTRPDPFTTLAANVEFYEVLAMECPGCLQLDKIIIKLSTKSYEEFRRYQAQCQRLPFLQSMKFETSDDKVADGMWCTLLRKGPAKCYFHKSGLSDQVGFLPGTHFLQCLTISTVVPKTNESTCKTESGPNEQNNKMYIGYEYECPQGHRFIPTSPGKIGKPGAGADATKFLKNHVPLYMACSCGLSTAQAVKLHVITPTAPLKLYFRPQVRPAPVPCPLFFGNATTLDPGTYWVLRFPIVYEDSSTGKIYSAPPEPPRHEYGEIINPLFEIECTPEEQSS